MNAFDLSEDDLQSPASADKDVSDYNGSVLDIILAHSKSPSLEPETAWPVTPGEYTVLSRNAPVAVSTLSSTELADAITCERPASLSIIGKTETENIGIEKVVRNVIANPCIRYLIVAGKDPEGHRSGATLLSLSQNGTDETMRVIGSPGKRPVLVNVSPLEVGTFRKQVEIIDMIDCGDAGQVLEKIIELGRRPVETFKADLSNETAGHESVPVISARASKDITLDRAGYFVIIPQEGPRRIVVEHYSYDNRLLGVINGLSARDLYATIIANGWVSELSHAAYLGKELEKAELSMKLGFKYIQDGA